jgi:hypothetical protein
MNDNEDHNMTPTSTSSSGAATATAAFGGESANLAGALVGGLVAAVIGALIWAVITVTTKFQIGFMAVGVGFLVAWAVRTLGKGRDATFGIIGGVFALLGCLLGNLLSACGFIAGQASEPVVSVTLRVLANPASIATILQASFQGMDLLFYAIAVYEGYKLSRRP